MSRLFPGMVCDLVEAGAAELDLPGDIIWFQEGGHTVRFYSGISVIFLSRPLLEWYVRCRVLAIPNLTCLQGCRVQNLIASADGKQIKGVKVRQRGEELPEAFLEADLVIDATGRSSQSPLWLEKLGYPRPDESIIKINLGYTTRTFKQDPTLLPNAKGILTIPSAPVYGKRGGGLFPIEGGRWIVTLGGWLEDHAPADEPGFLEYAKSLPSQDIYHVISRAEPLTDFVTHKLPSNLRRHYERMSRFPKGYLVLGDAICSFNPIYGQGMSVSAMEAEALEYCLQAIDEQNHAHDLAREFFTRAAKVIDHPWRLTIGEDFRFPEVEGPKPAGTDLMNWYASQLHKATFRDREVARAFFQVVTLTHAPQSLLNPTIVLRVMQDHFRWPT